MDEAACDAEKYHTTAADAMFCGRVYWYGASGLWAAGDGGGGGAYGAVYLDRRVPPARSSA